MEGATRTPWPLVGKAALIAAPALVLPLPHPQLGGGGVATATEVSTIAVLYAMIVGAVLYGGISLRKLYSMLVETAALSGAILLILGCASAMAWGANAKRLCFPTNRNDNRSSGRLDDIQVVSILIFMILAASWKVCRRSFCLHRIMFPIARTLGINDIHYSMVVVVAMNIGPDGAAYRYCFYIACKIGNVSPDEAMGAIWPYLAAMIIGLLLIAAIPGISTILL